MENNNLKQEAATLLFRLASLGERQESAARLNDMTALGVVMAEKETLLATLTTGQYTDAVASDPALTALIDQINRSDTAALACLTATRDELGGRIRAARIRRKASIAFVLTESGDTLPEKKPRFLSRAV